MSIRFLVDVFADWHTSACVTHEKVTGREADKLKQSAEAQGKRVVLRPVRVGAWTERHLKKVEG